MPFFSGDNPGENEITQKASAQGAELSASSAGVSQLSTQPMALFDGKVLHSVRGLENPSRSVASFSEVVRDSNLTASQQEKLQEVWTQARVNGRDIGKDIRAIVPLLEQRPDLLEQLHTIATSNQLCLIQKADVSAKAFEAMRRDCLVELIRGAVPPPLVAQGETSACTGEGTRSCLSSANFLQVACGLVINGQATTIGGDQAAFGKNRDDFLTRLVPYAERVSGFSLHGDGEYTRSVGSVSSRMPSFTKALINAAVMEMFGGDVTAETGQFCHEYTQMVRSLSGFETACAGPNARILVDGAGRPVTSKEAAVGVVSQREYFYQALERISNDPQAHSLLTRGSDTGHPDGVLVDVKWSDPSGGGLHGRHFLKATGLVEKDGQQWVQLLNPIGDYAQGKTPPGSTERFYPPGTELGDKNSIWWKTGENGVVYVRKDVFEKNLMTVMVQYDERYVAGQSRPVRLLGTLEQQKATFDAPVDWIVPAPRNIETAQSPNTLTKVDKLTQEEEKKKTLAELALEQQAYARTKGQDQQNEPTFMAVVGRYQKEETKILRDYDEQQN
ncbi:MAG: hypothetical protein ACK5HO_13770, partial [Pseudomonadota bacterium]